MEEEILKRVRPTGEEEQKLMEVAEDVMSKIKIKWAMPELGGSAAKRTWLKGDNDVDIYVKFSKEKFSGKDISPILQQELKDSFRKIEVLHGSRDYFQFKHKGYTIEVIPIIDIAEAKRAENITDMSPFHVAWVRGHGEMSDDIRLTKAFCKANRIYGAESYIQGFSGYVLEILAVYYGGFRKLLEGATLWKDKEVIDPENHYKGRNILKVLNKSKTVSPLVLVDPVQADRNAAAGLSKKCFDKFREISAAYLKKPSTEFFKARKTTVDVLKEKAKSNKLLIFQAEPVKRKRDVAGAKMVKCLGMMKKHFVMNSFKVLDHGWEWNKKAMLWFIFADKKLPKKVKHYGPPSKSYKRMEGFRKKWKGKKMMEEKGLSYVVVDREYRVPEDFAKALIKKEFIKDKVKKIRLART